LALPKILGCLRCY